LTQTNKDYQEQDFNVFHSADFSLTISFLSWACIASPVPLSVIASWKKIKSLGATNQMLVKALRTSTKLVSQQQFLLPQVKHLSPGIN
jgi:hypothetical protein